MGGLANGLAQLFKQGSKRFGNAIDNFWLDAEARKAIEDEVVKKFQPAIDRALKGESRKANNITELGNKLAESKKALQDAKDQWQQKYDAALATAKNQRQTEINDYDAELRRYQDALDQANQGRQDIVDKLYQQEATYTPNQTIYTDINTGDKYLKHPITGEYKNITTLFKNAPKEKQKAIRKYMQGFEERLFDSNSKKVINVFDENISNNYHGKNAIFDNYLDRVEAPQYTAFKDADNQIKQADTQLKSWQNKGAPKALDEHTFKNDYEKTNGKLPKEYTFNDQTYSKQTDLDRAYQNALSAEQNGQQIYKGRLSKFTSARDKEIAKRIQDAKDINKAKLALKTGAGAGALAAGAAALYGGDDTDNTDNIDNTNTNNTDNTYTGEPDPDLNIENTPEGKAALIGKSLVDTDFDSDKADALASAAYDQGVEDGNSARSSGDLVNSIAAATGGHTIDDRLFELIKAMKDPYKADAVANYIYSRHGDDPEVQRLGWRGWLNKYYGDSLRSKMNIDPSSYKGMHVSGGL